MRKSNWIDLQLPVYRTRLQALEEGDIEVAVALLPHQVSKTEIDVAGWDDAMFESAEGMMDNILKRIGEFPDRPLEGAELDNPGGFGAERFDVLWGDGIRGTDSNGSVSEGGFSMNTTPPRRSIVIANAGCGKTWTLSTRLPGGAWTAWHVKGSQPRTYSCFDVHPESGRRNP